MFASMKYKNFISSLSTFLIALLEGQMIIQEMTSAAGMSPDDEVGRKQHS